MRYTNEERNRLVSEYSQRTGKNIEMVGIMFHKEELIEKSGSSGDSYLIENPIFLNDNGRIKKVRKNNSHLTAKKKKRK